ncbi:hypothetical protein [Dysgonomonas macrotermitis]|uniref:Uncharacterized protein n=1 Tax=Dysgonomonas macrotermitis TaxID=1346286 RepID=A0A1M4WXG9_9BACT|nr:hypothetical protein [Dysgonomonas macrotermitis]SHE85936.1 hypothetical protein SAMN05444362_102346 [Dysgonomonas macrotermitis]
MAILNKSASPAGDTFGIIQNVFVWFIVIACGFLLYKLYQKVFGSSGAGTVTSSQEKEILNHSSDRMSNGNTYMQSAEWLFNELWASDAFFPWLKNTDEAVVGRFMLTVTKSEFQQLSSVYLLLKREKRSWYQQMDLNASLSSDLDVLFSSSDKVMYMEHLS